MPGSRGAAAVLIAGHPAACQSAEAALAWLSADCGLPLSGVCVCVCACAVQVPHRGGEEGSGAPLQAADRPGPRRVPAAARVPARAAVLHGAGGVPGERAADRRAAPDASARRGRGACAAAVPTKARALLKRIFILTQWNPNRREYEL